MLGDLAEKAQQRRAELKRSYLRNYEYNHIYKKASKEPVQEDKVVFVELRQRCISNSFRVMFDELAGKYDLDIHTHFLLANSRNRNVFYDRAREMLEDIATARFVFVNEGSDVIGAIDPREGTDIIQLWHGCGAFKKFGLSTGDLLFGRTMEDQLKHPDHGNYSLVTVSSPEVMWAYEEAMNIKREENIIRPTGISRTDVFFDEAFIQRARDRFFRAVPQAAGKTVVLYAPTFRGRVRHAKTPDMLNLRMLRDALGEDYFVVVKHHPNVTKPRVIPSEFSSFAMDVSSMDIEDLICASDICITDYSSLVFEYSLLEKPIIFFAYDLDTYYDWRGFYYDYYEMAPGPVCTTNREMIDYILNLDERFDLERLRAFKERFMSSCDGHSTQRILEQVFGSEYLEAHRRAEPMNLPFHLVPVAGERYSVQKKREEEMRRRHAKLEALSSSARQVRTGSMAMLDCCKALQEVMGKCAQGVSIVKSKDLLGGGEAAKKLLSAEYIFIDHDVEALDALRLEAGQKVVLIPRDVVAQERTGRDALAYLGGLSRVHDSLFPPYKQVDYVVCDQADAQVYIKATGVGEGGVLATGNVVALYYSSTSSQEAARKKLFKLFPDARGKTVVADFVYRGSAKPNVGENSHDQYIYEQIGPDIALFKRYEFANAKRPVEMIYSDCMNSYTSSFFDATGKVSEIDLITAADVVIGAYQHPVSVAMCCGKPAKVYQDEMRNADGSHVSKDIDAGSPAEQVSKDPVDLAEFIRCAARETSAEHPDVNAVQDMLKSMFARLRIG